MTSKKKEDYRQKNGHYLICCNVLQEVGLALSADWEAPSKEL
jgi:regulator of RNase E activity RraB